MARLGTRRGAYDQATGPDRILGAENPGVGGPRCSGTSFATGRRIVTVFFFFTMAACLSGSSFFMRWVTTGIVGLDQEANQQ